jgi:hypothetical protein
VAWQGSGCSQSPQHRIRYHFSGNSEGSTLRLTLGCLLGKEPGIELRRVGNGKRMTFSAGEQRLNKWMEESAKVAWHVCDEPWKVEAELISTLDLPLNLAQNRHNGFHSVLSQKKRRDAKILVRERPVIRR